MAVTGERTLRLLSLLQRRRFWPGVELADRLDVSPRTLRRDVDRLRSLGYPIAAVSGSGGGYRFEPGSVIPPLTFDADEAVALTVALHTMASASDSGNAEAAAGALGKLIPVLPADVRARAEALRTVTDVGPPRPGRGADDAPAAAVLGTVAQACRDGVRLSFGYTPGDGVTTARYVEPYRLVALGRRWYLVAFDLERTDWRTFRVDRVSEPAPARTPFSPRPLPSDDLTQFVRDRIRALTLVHRIVADVELDPVTAAARVGPGVTIEPAADGARVSFDTDRLDWPLLVLGSMRAPFRIVAPPELRAEAASLGARLTASSG